MVKFSARFQLFYEKLDQLFVDTFVLRLHLYKCKVLQYSFFFNNHSINYIVLHNNNKSHNNWSWVQHLMSYFRFTKTWTFPLRELAIHWSIFMLCSHRQWNRKRHQNLVFNPDQHFPVLVPHNLSFLNEPNQHWKHTFFLGHHMRFKHSVSTYYHWDSISITIFDISYHSKILYIHTEFFILFHYLNLSDVLHMLFKMKLFSTLKFLLLSCDDI